jgi:hypothetical protein
MSCSTRCTMFMGLCGSVKTTSLTAPGRPTGIPYDHLRPLDRGNLQSLFPAGGVENPVAPALECSA